MGFSVTISDHQGLTWPDLCVRCGAKAPEARFTLRGESGGWGNRTLRALFNVGLPDLSYQVPCCPGCKTRLRLRHWGVTIGVASWGVLVGVALFGVGPWILGFDRAGHETTLGLAFFALVLGAMLAVYLYFPPWVRLETGDGQAAFTFRDRRFAEAFAAALGVQLG